MAAPTSDRTRWDDLLSWAVIVIGMAIAVTIDGARYAWGRLR